MLHGVHPLLPGDLTDATFLVSKFRPGMTTDELIQARARQLLRLPKDIARARKILQKSRFWSKEAYEKKFTRQLWKESFDPGDLVLVRNNRIENSVSIERKTADRYMGPYHVSQTGIFRVLFALIFLTLTIIIFQGLILSTSPHSFQTISSAHSVQQVTLGTDPCLLTQYLLNTL